MVIGATLGVLGLLGFGALLLKSKTKISDINLNSSTTDEIVENSKTFTEKYMEDDVVSSSSSEPYISSAEIVRPHDKPLNYKAYGNDDDDTPNKGKTFGGGVLTGASVATYLESTDGGKDFPWLLVLGLLGGGYVVYKVMK